MNYGDYSQELGGASGLNPLSDLNPEDIASLTALKDASAVAIYGSRGANGVVLIETKKGQMGKATIAFDYYTGFRSEEHTSELQSLMRSSYAVFRLDKTATR